MVKYPDESKRTPSQSSPFIGSSRETVMGGLTCEPSLARSFFASKTRFINHFHTVENQKKGVNVTPKQTGWIAAVVVALIAMSVFGTFPVLLVAATAGAIWWTWGKSKLPESKQIMATGGIVLAAVLVGSFTAYAHRTPVLTITSPENGVSLQAKSVIVEGKVSPASSVVTVNGGVVATEGGKFSHTLPLNAESNGVSIVAKNGKKSVSQSLTIARIFTDQEKADIAAAKAAAEAKAKAELAAYQATPAGRVCKKHPEWSKSDCQRIADGEIWLGMSITMLHAVRGLPDHVNISDYGNGKQYQWCYDEPSLRCYYGGADGVVTSYN